MNILFVLSDLDIGGSQNYSIGLMNEFAELDHNITVIVLSDLVFLKPRISKKINIQIWPRFKKLDFSIIKKLRIEIKLNTYDAIISNNSIYHKLATINLNPCPLTLFPIHSTVPRNIKFYLISFLVYHLKKKNEFFLTSIDDQTTYLAKIYHLQRDFFKQIYNGIDTEKFTLPTINFLRKNFLTDFGINPNHQIILMVAGFREEKRHIDAINAFELLKHVSKEVSLLFVGDNRINKCNLLENYCMRKKIRDIYFFTAENVKDIRLFYWCADIFTLTSDKVETFPISSLEAMSSGLPCVLTDTGGAKNFIIDDFNGYVVAPNDIFSIKDGWIKALSMSQRNIKEKIRNYSIQKYSIKKSAESYLNLIRSKK